MQTSRRQKRVYLELSPKRFEFVLVDGERAVAIREVRPVRSIDHLAWDELVGQFGAHVRAWVEDVGCDGCLASVIYAGPDTSVAMSSCPASAGSHRARLAARMTLAESVHYPLDTNPCDVVELFTDHCRDESIGRKLHSLVLADTETTLSRLADAVAGAGLKPVEFLPSAAVNLAAAVDALSDGMVSQTSAVILWVGNQNSAVAGMDAGSLSFARVVPVGIETLVEALASTHAEDGSAECVPLGLGDSREVLLKAGIPSGEEWAAHGVNVKARSVLPLIQPVLQRLIIELKQSIRFGLTPEARDTAVLKLAGPGASMPRMAETLAEGLGLQAATCQGKDVIVESCGDLVTVWHMRPGSPRLIPNGIVATGLARNTGRALLVGGMLGLAAIAADATHSWTQFKAYSRALEAAEDKLTASGGAPTALQDRAIAAHKGVSGAEARILSGMPASLPLGSFMRVLAACSLEGIALQAVEFQRTGGDLECVLRGTASGAEAYSETVRFGEYVDAIRQCPLVASMQLGETRRLQSEGTPELSFSVTVTLVTFPEPYEALAHVHDAGSTR